MEGEELELYSTTKDAIVRALKYPEKYKMTDQQRAIYERCDFLYGLTIKYASRLTQHRFMEEKFGISRAQYYRDMGLMQKIFPEIIEQNPKFKLILLAERLEDIGTLARGKGDLKTSTLAYDKAAQIWMKFSAAVEDDAPGGTNLFVLQQVIVQGDRKDTKIIDLDSTVEVPFEDLQTLLEQSTHKPTDAELMKMLRDSKDGISEKNTEI